MISLATRVARRYSLTILSDARFQPPRQILQGVDSGELPVQCLAIWKYSVEALKDHFSYGAGTAYWRNKCLKEGVELNPKYMEADQGATFGPFKIKSGDQIEDWVKEQMRSKGLYRDGIKVAYEWELELHHFQSDLAEAQERVAKHEAALAKKITGGRQKWLEGAKADLNEAQSGVDKAMKAIAAFKTEVTRYEDIKAPVIDFEQQFQSMLQSATLDLSKREILSQAKAALARFEAELANQAKTAGAMDTLWGAAEKAWNWAVASFHRLTDWVADLTSSTKRISKLLDSVS